MTAELTVESRARRPVTREISTFLLLVFFISAIPWSLVIFTGHLMTGGYLTVNLLMWCPALAAFSVCLLRRIPLSTIGWKWPAAKYLRLGYTIPILYAIPVYLLTWIFVPESFILPTFLQASAKLFRILHHPYLATFAMNIPLLLTAELVASLPRALGEEIGWRGFLLPRLVERFGFTTGCFSGGIIWALWHSPVLLGADYNVGTNRIYALVCFTIMVTADTYILGWLRMKSGSVWPCALMHAIHNIVIQAILDAMTTSTGRAPYLTTEFGCGLGLSTTIFALYFVSRRQELQKVVPQRPDHDASIPSRV